MPSFASRSFAHVAAVLVLVLAATLLTVVLVRGGSAQSQTTPKRFDSGCQTTAVRFGVVAPDGDRAARRAAQTATRELSGLMHCPVVVVTRPTQTEMLTALALHQIDFAEIDPAALIVGERVVALTILGAYSTRRDTAARTSPSRLWARANGAVRGLRDVRGRRLTLGPRLTSGGDLLPRAALLAAGVPVAGSVQAGTTRSAATVTRAPDDRTALQRLRAGRTDVVVTRGDVRPRDRRGLRLLWGSTSTLADVVVVRPGVRSGVRRLILFAVRNLDGPALTGLAARQGIARPLPLLPVSPDLYGPLSAQFDALTSAGLAP